MSDSAIGFPKGRQSGKSDNTSLGLKLKLRRHFLSKYHSGDTALRVFDACMGEGEIWKPLLAEYPITRYWGVDKKPAEGRLALDSARVLAQPGWKFDVIDVDTYGSPWTHWRGILQNGYPQPLTVFLTVGGAGGMKPVDYAALHMLGLAPIMAYIPNSIRWSLNEQAIDHCLSKLYLYDYKPLEVLRAAQGNAIYFGLRIIPTEAKK